MNSKTSSGTRQRTRRAILEAMVDVIMESDGIGFSVQAVADRAGVTHRTVYNHFPTREALNDAFAEHVEQALAELVDGAISEQSLTPEERDVAQWPRLARESSALMSNR